MKISIWKQTGNYYYGARYYNPKWSVWLSVDPLAEQMPSWSSYNYAFSNPIKFNDPTGMAPEIMEFCPADWIFDKKTNKYVYDGSITSTSGIKDYSRFEYVGVGDKDVQAHFNKNNPFLKYIKSPAKDMNSFKSYLGDKISEKLTNYFETGTEQNLNDIRGLYENINPTAINKGRYNEVPINIELNNKIFKNSAYAEIKLFNNKNLNTFRYSDDTGNRYNSKHMKGITHVYQFEFYSPHLKVSKPQPSVHLFISNKAMYDEIKKYSN